MARVVSQRPSLGRRFAVRAWVTGVLILLSTYALVLAHGIQPHEWAAGISFVAAHILAAEVIREGHRQK